MELKHMWGKSGYCAYHSIYFPNFVQHWLQSHSSFCEDCEEDVSVKNWPRHMNTPKHQKNEKMYHRMASSIPFPVIQSDSHRHQLTSFTSFTQSASQSVLNETNLRLEEESFITSGSDKTNQNNSQNQVSEFISYISESHEVIYPGSN
jgi:hypothetical protein